MVLEESDSQISFTRSKSAMDFPKTSSGVKKEIIILVGLPATGKSYIGKKITNYFQWLGYNAKVFNVGNHRRVIVHEEQNHDFFDSHNVSAKKKRDELAYDTLQEALRWLENGNGNIVVYDATNTTHERRKNLLNRIKMAPLNVNVTFCESICDDKKVIESNMKQKISNSPDYCKMDPVKAMEDLSLRIDNYKKVYERIKNDDISYIKCINLQSKVIANNLKTGISHRLCALLMSIHIEMRPIYLSRAGQFKKGVMQPLGPLMKSVSSSSFASFSDSSSVDEMNLEELGKFSSLTHDLPTANSAACKLNANGRCFSTGLRDFLKSEGLDLSNLTIYTSPLPRAIETVSTLTESHCEQWSCLNILDTGICHGKTVQEIKKIMPHEYSSFIKSPFSYRIPGGESFADKVRSLESFVVDVERQRGPVLIISHLSTLQLLQGYFLGLPFEESISKDIPQHSVIKLVPEMYGWKKSVHNIPKSSLKHDQISEFPQFKI